MYMVYGLQALISKDNPTDSITSSQCLNWLSIGSLSTNGRFCEKNLFESRDHFYYGRCHSLVVPQCLQGILNMDGIRNNYILFYLQHLEYRSWLLH